MDNLTALKCAIAIINKRVEEKPTGGIKLTISGKEIKAKYSDILESLEALEINVTKTKVKFCKDCDNFQAPPNAKQGWCFMKEFTSTRKADDFCSLHCPKSKGGSKDAKKE